MEWTVTYSCLKKVPDVITTTDTGRNMTTGAYDDLERQIRQLANGRNLEFDYFTDQTDVWSVRKNGRRDRFMILMA